MQVSYTTGTISIPYISFDITMQWKIYTVPRGARESDASHKNPLLFYSHPHLPLVKKKVKKSFV
jgi:hypothetical protein